MRPSRRVLLLGGTILLLLALAVAACTAAPAAAPTAAPPEKPAAAAAAPPASAPAPAAAASAPKPAAAAAPTAVPTPPNPYSFGRVRAVGATDGQVLPDKKVSITLHGGYAYHDNDKIVTSGLPNVPVSTTVYLEGAPLDSHEEKLTAWKWQLETPAFSKAKLTDPNSQLPSFVADRPGSYQLTVTATNAKGETGKSSFKVNAGVYTGVQTCASCHSGSVQPDMVSNWLQTGHARKVETTYARYTAESDYCVQCHTTGYNESDAARGFDDRARAIGWNPSQGSLTEFLVKQKWSVDQVLASEMGALANIQCESCHGPGGSTHTAVASYEVGVCAQCHSAQPAQWKGSGHANTGRATLHMAEGDCIACHTGQGFVEVKVRGNTPVFPNQATPQKPANLLPPGDQPPVGCATCHDPHRATFPNEPREGHSLQLRMKGNVKMPNGTTVDAEFSAVCVSCHANKRDVQYMADFLDGKKARGVHDNSQADIFYGVGGITYGESLGNSAHTTAVREGCIECHMAASPVMDPGPDKQAGTRDDVKATSTGGHSWAMTGKFTGLAGGKQATDLGVQNVGSCNTQGCHASVPLTTFNRKANSDYDGDGNVEGIQDEVDGLLKALADKLPKDDKGEVLAIVNDKNTNREQRQALWNYFLVKNDGSRGVHNPTFAVQLLQKTYKKVTGADVPNAKLR